MNGNGTPLMAVDLECGGVIVNDEQVTCSELTVSYEGTRKLGDVATALSDLIQSANRAVQSASANMGHGCALRCEVHELDE